MEIDRGRPKNHANDEIILNRIDEHPETSTRVLGVQIGVYHMKVCRTVKEQLLPPSM